jgi:hypothetical protein
MISNVEQWLRGIMGSITHHNQDLLDSTKCANHLCNTHTLSHSTLDTTTHHDKHTRNEIKQ